MGGLKAVVWTDVFQMVVVYAGLFVMVFRGAFLFGGFDEIWQTATEGLRINLDQVAGRSEINTSNACVWFLRGIHQVFLVRFVGFLKRDVD